MKEHDLDGHPRLFVEFEVREGQKIQEDWLAWEMAAFMRDHSLTKLEVYYGQTPDKPVEKVGIRKRLGLQSKPKRVPKDSGNGDDKPVKGGGGKSLLGEIDDEGDGAGTGASEE